MRQVLRAALAAAVVATLIATPGPAGAAPAETPRVRAAPGSDLQDGQVVAVFGKGFARAGTLVGVAQCPAGVTSVVDACVGHTVVDSNGGSFATSFRVQRFVGPTDCAAAPATCVIGATNLNGAPAFTQVALARLRFGDPGVVLQTTLTGLREVGADGAPGAGDLDAVGAATLIVRSTSLCATLSVKAVDLPSVAAHVHEQAAGANGPIVVPLKAPGPLGRSHACVTGVAPVLLSRLVSQPWRFYVNVHTDAFPNGAVRGQLARAEREGVMLAARLSGSREIGPDGRPGAGDPEGQGVVTITADEEAGRICFELFVRGVSLPAVAAHIHKARPTANGDIVVTLVAPGASGRSSGCVGGVDLFFAIRRPARLYVNVHTTQFPDGAVRGQLAPAAALAG